MTWFTYFFSLFAIAWVGTGIYRWYAIEKGYMDKPNKRSSHITPTPRGAGIVFVLAWAGLIAVLDFFKIAQINLTFIFVPAFFMALLGFWDDKHNLSYKIRLIAQIALAFLSIYLMLSADLNFGNLYYFFNLKFLSYNVLLVITGLGLVWFTNLFNFMDGTDGIATCEAIFILLVAGYIFNHYNASDYTAITVGLAFLLTGFLAWNWPSARVFMGDSGSAFLGFVLAMVMLLTICEHQINPIFWLIITGIFWFDTTVTLIRRIINGDKFTQAHKLHAYQRLVQANFSHAQVLVGSILLNGILGSIAFYGLYNPRYYHFCFALSIVILTLVYLTVEIIHPMYKKLKIA